MVLQLNSLSARSILLDLLIPILQSTALPPTGVKVSFSSRDGDLSASDRAALLWKLSGLEVLAFSGFKAGLDGILYGLSQPTDNGDGTKRWLCPQLHTIRLEDCGGFHAERLLQLSEGRITAARGADGSDSGRPVPLQELEVSGTTHISRAVFDRMSSVLGEEVLKWNAYSTTIPGPHAGLTHGTEQAEEMDEEED